MLNKETQALCCLFADVLEYPGNSLVAAAANCGAELGKVSPALAEQIKSFNAFLRNQSLEAMEELYTQTFDVTPVTSLYLGYHLFGETPKRSVLLTRLEEAYQSHAFSRGIELADHLGVILRFLSVTRDWEFAGPLLVECVLPTLARIKEELRKNDNQYALVIGALRLFLQRAASSMAMAGGVGNV